MLEIVCKEAERSPGGKISKDLSMKSSRWRPARSVRRTRRDGRNSLPGGPTFLFRRVQARHKFALPLERRPAAGAGCFMLSGWKTSSPSNSAMRFGPTYTPNSPSPLHNFLPSRVVFKPVPASSSLHESFSSSRFHRCPAGFSFSVLRWHLSCQRSSVELQTSYQRAGNFPAEKFMSRVKRR